MCSPWDDTDNIPDVAWKYHGLDAVSISFTIDQIEKKMRKSAGPNGLHPRVLSELSQSIKFPLSIISQKSYDGGYLSEGWKKPYVTLVHKKGSKVTINSNSGYFRLFFCLILLP